MLWSLLRRASPCLLALALWTGVAHARTSIGANLAMSFLSSEDDSHLQISAPATSDPFVFGVVPGLRIGLAEQARTAPVLEAGIMLAADEGTLTLLNLAGHVRHHLGARPDAGLYLTAGLGLMLASFESDTESRFGFGFGVGSSTPVSNDMGRMRVEVRFDHVLEKEEDGFTTAPAINALTLKIGFDLLSPS